jgi:AbrB family looped-hinge helix DNA binding protein
MANRVGPKGQVVIEKEIRDRLGLQPGWIALQRLVDGHVEISFLPPEHNESLAGVLDHLTDVYVAPDDFHEATETAWAWAARRKMGLEPRDR